jgi:spore maturation protein SpmA
MALNAIWIGLVLLGFLVSIIKTIIDPTAMLMSDTVNSIFAMCQDAVMNIALPLVGILAFWLGIMKIAENAGAINWLARFVSPVLSKILKDVPEGHPAHGAVVMNFSANMLGLDNAATPLGLKAMQHLQEINPDKTRASDAQIMFLVLNTSGLTVIPTSIIAYRQAAGAADPTDVFVPILLATTLSTIVGFLVAASIQRISILNATLLGFIALIGVLLGAFVGGLSMLNSEQLGLAGKAISAGLIIFFIAGFILLGVRKKLNVFEHFVDGAKEGFNVALQLLPYLVGLLAAIAVFRTSGAMEYMLDGIRWVAELFTNETRFTDALPVGFMKPLSGGGSRALMLDSWGAADAVTGFRPAVDSFVGRMTSTMQGSTETTLFVLAIYFGSVGIKNTRYAAGVGLIADLAGIVAAIVVCYAFFG